MSRIEELEAFLDLFLSDWHTLDPSGEGDVEDGLRFVWDEAEKLRNERKT